MLLADCTESGALRGYAMAEQGRPGRGAGRRGRAQRRVRCSAPDTWPSPATRAATWNATRASSRSRARGLAEMRDHYFRTSGAAPHPCPPGLRPDPGRLARQRLHYGEGRRRGRHRTRCVDGAPEAQEEAWRTALALARTLTDAELLDDALPARRAAAPAVPRGGWADARPAAGRWSYGCRCSRARLAGVLAGLPGGATSTTWRRTTAPSP